MSGTEPRDQRSDDIFRPVAVAHHQRADLVGPAEPLHLHSARLTWAYRAVWIALAAALAALCLVPVEVRSAPPAKAGADASTMIASPPPVESVPLLAYFFPRLRGPLMRLREAL